MHLVNGAIGDSIPRPLSCESSALITRPRLLALNCHFPNNLWSVVTHMTFKTNQLPFPDMGLQLVGSHLANREHCSFPECDQPGLHTHQRPDHWKIQRFGLRWNYCRCNSRNVNQLLAVGSGDWIHQDGGQLTGGRHHLERDFLHGLRISGHQRCHQDDLFFHSRRRMAYPDYLSAKSVRSGGNAGSEGIVSLRLNYFKSSRVEKIGGFGEDKSTLCIKLQSTNSEIVKSYQSHVENRMGD